jgi:hypothetical protein
MVKGVMGIGSRMFCVTVTWAVRKDTGAMVGCIECLQNVDTLGAI